MKQQGKSRLIQTLRILRDEISGWNPEESELIHAFVEVMPEVLHQVPETMPEIRALLHLTLEGLQALQHLDATHRRSLATTIAKALAIAEKCVKADDNPNRFAPADEVAREILQLLGRNPAIWQWATQQPEARTKGQLTLDDVAALVMQLETTYTAELCQVRDAHNRLAGLGEEGLSIPPAAPTVVA